MLSDHPFRDYRGRRVTVMGLGSFGGGVGAVRFLVDRGAIVTVTDLRPESQLAESLEELRRTPPAVFRLGTHDEADFANAELIVVNPAIRRDHPLLRLAASRGIPLTSEMNLFWQHQRGTLLAVTGSNGKSTTTALLHAMLSARKSASSDNSSQIWLGGNIGRSLLPEVDAIQPGDLVVLELSSFQLADLDRLQTSPHVAVVTNFSPNHLDWHGNLAHYRWAKQTLLRWQTESDTAVLNADDPEVKSWPIRGRRLLFGFQDHGAEGVFLRGKAAVWRFGSIEQEFPIGEWLKLPGRHNLANALAAAAAALSAKATFEQVRSGLANCEPLPHRLQFVAEVQGRRFYNDSLATTPESAMAALEAFHQPIVLLAGGYDKGVDLSDFAGSISRRVKAIAMMGETAGTLQSLLQEHVAYSTRQRSLALDSISQPLPNFDAAFQWAWEHSASGDVILLSPGCASYDWFRNFADRGDRFTALVRQIEPHKY